MEKTTVKEALKNIASIASEKILDAFAQEKFVAKFRDCKNAWYKGYEVVNECTIQVKYAFKLNSVEQSGKFTVEL
jgi:hypothetical protein